MVRLFASDRFLIRRSGPLFHIFDMKLQRNVGNGKGEDVSFVKRSDANVIKNEMTARVAVLSCDDATKKAILQDA